MVRGFGDLGDDGEDDDVTDGAAGELGPAAHPRVHGGLLLGQASPHHGNGVIQAYILDMDIMEKVLEVKGEDAVKIAQQMALQEGLLVGLSSGANTVAAIELAKRPENKGKLIVTVHPSAGERYLSSTLFQGLRKETEAMQPVPVD
ncbi:hypothetical protein ZWY2020_016831 [Hordeum vulgare]|nr:hypothetical protein ZWY2020_016831 [Hordeum vulgare]